MKNIFALAIGLCIGVACVIAIFKVSHKNVPSFFLRPLATTQFSVAVAPANALPATITSLSGDVDWKSRTATDASRITHTITLQQGEEISTKTDGRAHIEISQAVAIALAPDTHLLLAQTLPADIVVVQTTGIADYTKQGADTFSVRVFDVVVNVKEGVSNIAIINNAAIVTVNTGSITIAFNDANNVSHIQQVTSGYLVRINNLTQEVNVALP